MLSPPLLLGPEHLAFLRAAPQLARVCQLRLASSVAAPAAPAAVAEAAKPVAAASPEAVPAPLNFNDPKEAFKAKSTGEIVRSLLVFKACKIGPLVRNADSLLRLSKRVFGSTLTNFVLRNTFYKQFVAGSDAQDIQPTLAFLRRNGIRAILDYAAEDDVEAEAAKPEVQAHEQPEKTGVVVRTYSYEGEGLCDRRMAVFRKSIEAAGLAEGQGFAAIKVTALGLPALLERVSNALVATTDLFRQFDTGGDGFIDHEEFARVYQDLFVDGSAERIDNIFKQLDPYNTGRIDYLSWTKQITPFDTQAIAKQCRTVGPFARAALDEEENQLLRNMMRRVETLAEIAAQSNVRLMIDAEHSYFQPAIDNTVAMLQTKFNREEPVVFNTYQCYLKDSYDRLLLDLERAKREGFHFGAKLVRGAYMVIERARAVERDYPSPILDTKADTDASYDRCAAEVLSRIQSEGAEVMIATHNQASIERVVAVMQQLGLPPQSGVYFGQLLGMADHLTFTLGAHGYGAYKYVPFGAVDEVIPYLVRRAQENSDMLGGVGQETAMMRTELRRRLLGGGK